MPDGTGGFTNFLFQGQTPPAVTSATNTGSNLPLWYSSYLSTLANQAAGIASQPYQTYPGARIAPQDPQEVQGYNFLGANAGNWQGPLQQAQGAAGSVAGGFNPEQFNQYMSPYIGGVVNEIGRLGQQNLTENLLPTLNNEFVGSGGYGSDRNRTMDERLVRDVGANISGQQGMALQGAFSNAMQNYGAGQQNVNAAANNLGGLSQMQQALTTGQAGALSASGATNRGFGQANTDLAYQDWQNQLNFPRQNVAFLSSVLRGSAVPTSQDTTQTAPFSGSMSPSPLATFAGMAGAGMGMSNTGIPPKVASGGYVRVIPYSRSRIRVGSSQQEPTQKYLARGGLARSLYDSRSRINAGYSQQEPTPKYVYLARGGLPIGGLNVMRKLPTSRQLIPPPRMSVPRGGLELAG